ncbi:hypothetical protein SELMODRAFT_445783 [Selaginella moellendorffii]|uniref:BHLH domain-containing protein n=1 Tax=Selaginella moellendorffii TaxID=88036 RepID=D8SLD3_SELML|nr:transcription factor bHLH121 [Selaginella moellendorffii]EFJ14637.1 hypothetical protein SELMODRAFT_445783 [Selaginella moellendorffii]|eukprot:XP_002984127.1 transcription factor bHLH121 [Selaginella moellendorffii]
MTQEVCEQRPSGPAGTSLVSRKVHKADREKLRRDKLNEQFAELAAVLDPEKPKQDKASILGDSLQAVKNLRVEIKRLRIERGTLFDESRDLKRERDDLEEEKAALEKQTDELEVQVQQLFRSAAAVPCFKQPAAPGPSPAFAAAATTLRPHVAPPLNTANPFVYLTSPSSCMGRVERPCAQYPVADFLSKVQSSHGFQPTGRGAPPLGPGSRRGDHHVQQCCLGCRDGDSDDIQLHLGQPPSRHEIDTDLHLQLSSSPSSSSAAKGASLCPS